MTRGFYKGGLSAAEGVVDGLKKEADAIAREIERVAERSADAIRRALGLPPKSKSKKRGGQFGMESASTVSSTPRALSVATGSSAPANGAPASLSTADAALIGAALAEAWHKDPPKALLALTQRDQARLHQAGRIAASNLGRP